MTSMTPSGGTELLCSYYNVRLYRNASIHIHLQHMDSTVIVQYYQYFREKKIDFFFQLHKGVRLVGALNKGSVVA